MKKNKIIIVFLLSVLSLLFVTRFWENNYLLALILFSLNLLSLAIINKKVNVYVYIIACIFGTLAEITAIYYGPWSYANVSFLNVPLWLPFLWGQAGIFIINTLTFFKEMKKWK